MAIEICDRESLRFKHGSDEVELYFHRPGAKEMVKYLAQSLSGKSSASSEAGGEGLESMLEAGIDLACSCIIGVREGDVVLVDGASRQVLVTDPDRPGYAADWKEILKQKIPGLLLMLGNHLVKLTRSELEAREKNWSGTSASS
jgi:hypothetical protein